MKDTRGRKRKPGSEGITIRVNIRIVDRIDALRTDGESRDDALFRILKFAGV